MKNNNPNNLMPANNSNCFANGITGANGTSNPFGNHCGVNNAENNNILA
jgi:hypothetical protein